MAKKGIRYAVFGLYHETTVGTTTTITYTDGKRLSPVAAFNGSPNVANAKDYGDDGTVESVNEALGATLSVELTNDDMEIFTMLLGHHIVNNVLTYTNSDEPPYVGCGAIGVSGSKWRAKIYTKVRFAEPSDDNTTKQESISFSHITLEGDAVMDANGVWKKEREFDTEAAAKAWLNDELGVGASGATGATGATT